MGLAPKPATASFDIYPKKEDAAINMASAAMQLSVSDICAPSMLGTEKRRLPACRAMRLPLRFWVALDGFARAVLAALMLTNAVESTKPYITPME